MPSPDPTTTLGFEDALWAASDLLRGRLDPAIYKHAVLEVLYRKAIGGDGWAADLLSAPPPDLARLELAPGILASLVALIDDVALGPDAHDTLGRVYEYFLGRFASAEGRGGGEFYTPPCVVQLLVSLLDPIAGTVYDPCCGSGGMFVQAQLGRGGLRCHGQESNPRTFKLAQRNLTLRGLDFDLGPGPADTLHQDLHPDLRADHVLANPPFNIARWGAAQLAGDPRWAFGEPPDRCANFAWIQHILHHLAPAGTGGVVLANGSLSATTSGEGALRSALVAADVVEAIVALPDRLFYATQIPACIWVLARGKASDSHRDRSGEVLFVDATRLGRMETRVHRVLDAPDVARIAQALHRWRDASGAFTPEPGFCASATLDQVAAQGGVLTPGRFVGAPPPNTEQQAPDLGGLVAKLRLQMAQARASDEDLEAALHALARD